jgi:hypothetical protein
MATASNGKPLVHTQDCHSHESCRSVHYNWHQLLNSFNFSVVIGLVLFIPYNPQKGVALVHHCISTNITFLEAFTVTELNKIYWADSHIRRFKSTIISETDCDVTARIMSDITSLMMGTDIPVQFSSCISFPYLIPTQ